MPKRERGEVVPLDQNTPALKISSIMCRSKSSRTTSATHQTTIHDKENSQFVKQDNARQYRETPSHNMGTSTPNRRTVSSVSYRQNDFTSKNVLNSTPDDDNDYQENECAELDDDLIDRESVVTADSLSFEERATFFLNQVKSTMNGDRINLFELGNVIIRFEQQFCEDYELYKVVGKQIKHEIEGSSIPMIPNGHDVGLFNYIINKANSFMSYVYLSSKCTHQPHKNNSASRSSVSSVRLKSTDLPDISRFEISEFITPNINDINGYILPQDLPRNQLAHLLRHLLCKWVDKDCVSLVTFRRGRNGGSNNLIELSYQDAHLFREVCWSVFGLTEPLLNLDPEDPNLLDSKFYKRLGFCDDDRMSRFLFWKETKGEWENKLFYDVLAKATCTVRSYVWDEITNKFAPRNKKMLMKQPSALRQKEPEDDDNSPPDESILTL